MQHAAAIGHTIGKHSLGLCANSKQIVVRLKPQQTVAKAPFDPRPLFAQDLLRAKAEAKTKTKREAEAEAMTEAKAKSPVIKCCT